MKKLLTLLSVVLVCVLSITAVISFNQPDEVVKEQGMPVWPLLGPPVPSSAINPAEFVYKRFVGRMSGLILDEDTHEIQVWVYPQPTASDIEWQKQLFGHKVTLNKALYSRDELDLARQRIKDVVETMFALHPKTAVRPNFRIRPHGRSIRVGFELGDGSSALKAEIEALKAEIEQASDVPIEFVIEPDFWCCAVSFTT